MTDDERLAQIKTRTRELETVGYTGAGWYRNDVRFLLGQLAAATARVEAAERALENIGAEPGEDEARTCIHCLREIDVCNTDARGTWDERCPGGVARRALAASQGAPTASAPAAGGPMELAARQAEDPGLWFVAQTAAEAYLQRALRALHAAVEGAPTKGDGG